MLTVLLLSVFCLGCGGSGVDRYQISGNVTYAGKPLAAGNISFEPDAAAGNSGPGVSARIENGKYATESGKGTVGGKHIVRITPPELASGSDTTGAVQFETFKTTVDLPKQDAQKDFDIPAAGAKGS